MIRLWRAVVLLAAAAVLLPASAPPLYEVPASWRGPGDCQAAGGPVQGRAESLTAGGHTDVNSVAFGRLGGAPVAVSAGDEGTVRVWRLPGFEPAAEPLEGTAAAYLEPRGRPGVLTEGSYGARLWDLEAREILMRFPEGTKFAQGPFRGRPALLAAREGMVRVIDLGSLSTVRTVRTTGAEAIAAGRWGGREVVVAYEGDEAPFTVWDLGSGRVVGGGFGLGEENAVPSGTRVTELGGRAVLLVRTSEGVHRFDLGRGRPEGFLAGSDELSAWAFALSGDLVAFGEMRSHSKGDFAVPASIVLRRLDGTEVGRLAGHGGSVTALAAGVLDGRPVLLSGSTDNTVRLWDLRSRSGLGPPSPAEARDGIGEAAVTVLGGRPVGVVAEVNGPVRMWDLARRKPLGVLEAASAELSVQLAVTGPVPAAGSRADGVTGPVAPAGTDDVPGPVALVGNRTDDVTGPVALVGNRTDDVGVWDLHTRARLGRLESPPGKPRYLRDLVAVPPLAVAVSGGRGVPRAYAWDLRTRRLVHAGRLGGRRGWVSLSPIRDRAYAVVYGKRRARVWDAASGRRIASFPLRSERQVSGLGHAVEFGCRPALLLTSYESGGVRVLDAVTGRDLRPPIELDGAFGRSVWVLGAATVRGRVLAFTEIGVDDERRRELWDLTAGRRIGEPLGGSESQAFAAADRQVITGGPGERLQLWTLGG